MRDLLLLFLFFFGSFSDSMAVDQWIQRANFGGTGRHRGTGIGIANKAYCGLGHTNGPGPDVYYSDWWEYDPATNSWTQKASYPGNFGMGESDVVVVATETVGFIGLGQEDAYSFYKFEPQTNLWTQVTSPPPTVVFHNLHAFSVGHKGYFPALFSNRFFEYDMDTDTWTELNNLPFSTFYGIPTFSINDKGYIKDGANFYEYKPATDSWLPRAPFPGTTPNRPKGISQNGYGFFIGGMTPGWVWSGEVWRYDPINDSWLQLEDFPGTIRRWATVLKIDERVYYGMGTNGTNFTDFWEFNSIAGLEKFDGSAFNAFPAPASDHVYFTSDQYSNFEIVIYDPQGKSITSISTSNGKARLERGNLESGAYLYHVVIDGTTVSSNRIVFM